jgi:hypothetical protein
LLQEGINPAGLVRARAFDQADREGGRFAMHARGGCCLIQPQGNAGLLILAIGAAQFGAVKRGESGGMIGHNLISPETIRKADRALNLPRLRCKIALGNGWMVLS